MKDNVKENNKKIKENIKKNDDKELDTLKNMLKESEEKVVRAQADLVNYRKRKDDEVSRMLEYANEDLIKDILPVVDNLKRATKVSKELTKEEVLKFIEGVDMVYKNLVSTLERYGGKEIDCLGKKFDPSLEDAVMQESDPEKEKELVTEVFQKGYKLKDKVLRPAMVKVNK